MKAKAIICAALAAASALAADFISVEGPVPEVNKGGCSTAVFVRPVTNHAAVVSARWTVTGLGVFRVFLNGAEVGAEDFLKPGYTHPRKRRSSFSYDVTDAFRRDPGARNVLCAEVSTGWWRDAIVGRAGKISAFHCVLKISYADGSVEEIATDTSWRAAYAGPLRHATIWGGEKYDARVPTPWRTTGDVNWKLARVNGEFKGVVTPLEGRSVRVRRDLAFSPRAAWVWKGADGAAKGRHGRARILRRYVGDVALVLEQGETLVVDFGQNCADVPEFTARAAAGTDLTGHPAEMLNDADGEKSRGNDGPAGSAYFANYRTAESRLRYVFAGGDDETWHPSCTFFGGRYWSFTANGRVEFKRLRLLPVMSIAPEDETGTIVTGDASLNRLISNCLWGMRSNYLSVPTDCPQRNERWGWSGDTQVFAGAAVYAADVYGFLSKWMTDMRDSQAGEKSKYPGMFPKVAPGEFGGRLIGWADAGVIVPYTLWRQFGDVSAVNVNWDAMARFMASLDKSNWTTPEDERQCVDWLSPAMYEGHRRGWGSRFCKNPFWDGETNADERQYWDMLGACQHIWDLKMMDEMAKATGRSKEAEAYAQREAKAVARYRSLFLDHNGRLAERYRNMQTPNLFALKLGLFPTQAATDAAKADLVASIKAGNCKVGTGFLGTPLLLDVIADIVGDPGLAYSVLLQRDCPGWLYSVDNGATTIWERWDGYTTERGFGPQEMNSFNHYANGAVLGWMYRTMAGIRPGDEAGYRHFTLAPKPDKRIGSCKASYRTKYGTVKSEWRYVDGGKLEWSFTVPPGTTATVIPPNGGPTEEYGSGDYLAHYAVISAETDANGSAETAARTILIHSHNDYAQKRPFWGAYEAGADSIEADVFLVDGELIVAHSRSNLKPENTLRSLYLEPLREVFKKNGGRARANGRPLQLLVDLKNGKPAFDALLALIEREGFRDCFDICTNPAAARLTITGDNAGIDFSASPEFVFFDVPSNRKLDAEQYKRVWLVSDYARIHTKWRSGEMTEDDKRRIREAAAQAHAKGVLFRLWGFPDNPNAWRLSLELGLDYINTDRPSAAAAYISERSATAERGGRGRVRRD